MNNLTIGTIYQDTRTSKYFELTAINKETNKLQLSGIDEQNFTCMTESSLRKHYKLIAMSMKEFRPETAVVTIVTKEPIVKFTRKQRIIKHPNISTNDLITKYGNYKSKSGETYRDLYINNKDNVFRYFKIRLPLLKIAGII